MENSVHNQPSPVNNPPKAVDNYSIENLTAARDRLRVLALDITLHPDDLQALRLASNLLGDTVATLTRAAAARRERIAREQLANNKRRRRNRR